jgi:hypothetical protein
LFILHKGLLQKKQIPFYDEKVLSLIEKAGSLLDEISPPIHRYIPKITDEFLQRKRTDEDFTESCIRVIW